MEHTTKRPLVLSTPPHVFDGITTQKVMLNVVIALVPTLIASFVIFGWRALLVTAVTTAACVLFEYLWCLLRKTPQTAGDLSAVVTGLLLAFNLPSTIPLYMAVIGSFVAIVVVKELFGGIGRNFANPAIVARIVLSVSFTAAMTNYAAPRGFLPGATGVDAVSSATPLAPGAAQLPFMDLLFGVHPGVLGETCGIAILLASPGFWSRAPSRSPSRACTWAPSSCAACSPATTWPPRCSQADCCCAPYSWRPTTRPRPPRSKAR